MYIQNTPPPPPYVELPTEPKRSRAPFITILALSITAFIFLIGMIYSSLQASAAQRNFEDQVDVTRELIQGYDAVTSLDFDKSEAHMDEAMRLQDKILDRIGQDALMN